MKLADRLRPAGPVDPSHTFRNVIEGNFFTRHRRVLAAVWLVTLLGMVGSMLLLKHAAAPTALETSINLSPIPRPLAVGVDPTDPPLSSAPITELVEDAAEGHLPQRSANGQMPVTAYAYPFDRTDPHPRIAIVLVDVGLQADLLKRVEEKLSGAVGLAFNAYTNQLDQALIDARKAGHETLITLPTESLDPALDAGGNALRPSLTIEDNIQRMRLIFGRGSGYIGAVLPPDSAVPAKLNGLRNAMMAEMSKRGLGFFVNTPELAVLGRAQGAPTAEIALQLDRDLSPQGLTNSFFELEQRARETGQALAITALYPVMIERLAEWLPTLADRGIALAPASALVALPTPEKTPAQEEHGDEHAPSTEHAPASNNSHTSPHDPHGEH